MTKNTYTFSIKFSIFEQRNQLLLSDQRQIIRKRGKTHKNCLEYFFEKKNQKAF